MSSWYVEITHLGTHVYILENQTHYKLFQYLRIHQNQFGVMKFGTFWHTSYFLHHVILPGVDFFKLLHDIS